MKKSLSRALVPLAVTMTAPFAAAQLPDWIAPPGETVLNTNFQQLQPTTGPVVNIVGGVFRFHTVTIPAGSVVRAIGDNPMAWIVDQMVVDGELSVRGQDGQTADTLGTANFPCVGGRGGPAGGEGGDGSPNSQRQSLAGQVGNGAGNFPGSGGSGGLLSLLASCGRGSGGGGGAFATIGDPHYITPAGTGTSFAQRLGVGGFGCLGGSGTPTRTLIGGGPGGAVGGNDLFFGLAYDVHQSTWIQGSLPFPIGGAGGGGGGDLSHDHILLSPAFVQDARGGGGGGGGGCLLIASFGNIVIGPTGHVRADGGDGGGGEQAGSNNEGGGGGGGSGGMLLLATLGRVQLHAKGETYANLDYDFVLSADGGIGRRGPFLGTAFLRKYPSSGQTTLAGAVIDESPTGGFGGMGIVQIFARSGNNTDNTNTVLDDSIDVFKNGVLLSGAQKQRYLAWRGYRDAQGVFVDDAGVPTNIGDDEGDIRPAPFLLPL